MFVSGFFDFGSIYFVAIFYSFLVAVMLKAISAAALRHGVATVLPGQLRFLWPFTSLAIIVALITGVIAALLSFPAPRLLGCGIFWLTVSTVVFCLVCDSNYRSQWARAAIYSLLVSLCSMILAAALGYACLKAMYA